VCSQCLGARRGAFQRSNDYDLVRRVYGEEKATKLEGLVRIAENLRSK